MLEPVIQVANAAAALDPEIMSRMGCCTVESATHPSRAARYFLVRILLWAVCAHVQSRIMTRGKR